MIETNVALADVVAKLNQRYGALSVISGSDIEWDPPRMCSGIFSVDYAIGGGFPMQQLSILKGPEHGGKSSLALSVMSMVPRLCWRCFKLLPECTCSLPSMRMKTFWVDAENAFNSFWATKLGCKAEDYYIVRGDDGNQHGDMMDYALKSDECGLVVLDSIAAITPGKILEASLDSSFVGTQAKLVSDIMRKMLARLTIEAKRGHPCLIICTNQLRAVIGVMYGPSTAMAGGYSVKYTPSYVVNITKKSLQDKEKHYIKEKDLFTAQKHSFSVEKFRSLKLAESGEFIRATADNETQGYKRGEVLDYKTVIEALTEHGLLTKSSSGKFCFKDFKGAQRELVDLWRNNHDAYLSAQMEVIDVVKQKVHNA